VIAGKHDGAFGAGRERIDTAIESQRQGRRARQAQAGTADDRSQRIGGVLGR